MGCKMAKKVEIVINENNTVSMNISEDKINGDELALMTASLLVATANVTNSDIEYTLQAVINKLEMLE